ncbi:MAG: DUF2069 domain-containing protein [Betaproteobacteria bacterium]|nr:DUF2069 domain-containing protein [Betaproteobacteria bacterium]
MRRIVTLHYLAIAALIALILECVAWEGWLAPLSPGGSILVVKAIPLLFPLFGILHGKVYTYQWAPMLVLAYFGEGIVRAWAEHGRSQELAMLEIVLSMIFFFSSIFYVRLSVRHARSR